MNKIEAGKNLIKTADFILESNLAHFDLAHIYELDLDPEEIRTIINVYATQYAQICEYYLKALILPDLVSPLHEENSEEEAEYLINDRNGLKKYNHIYKRILNDSQFNQEVRKSINQYLWNYLPDIKGDRNKTLQQICKEENLADITKFSGLKMIIDPNSSRKADIVELLDRIIGPVGYIENNSDAYPASRYAMLNSYIADIQFLSTFKDALRNAIQIKYPNYTFASGINRSIFVDSNSALSIVYEDGSHSIMYMDQKNTLWLTRPDSTLENPIQEDSVGSIRKGYDKQAQKELNIYSIRYIEDGLQKEITRDRNTNIYYYVETSQSNLTKEKNK